MRAPLREAASAPIRSGGPTARKSGVAALQPVAGRTSSGRIDLFFFSFDCAEPMAMSAHAGKVDVWSVEEGRLVARSDGRVFAAVRSPSGPYYLRLQQLPRAAVVGQFDDVVVPQPAHQQARGLHRPLELGRSAGDDPIGA